MALDAGEGVRIARALAVEATFVATRGVPVRDQVQRLVQASLDLAGEMDDPFALASGTLHAGVSSYLLGDWRRGFERSDEASAIMSEHCTGILWDQNIARRFALNCLAYLGELAEVRRRVEVQLAEADERGNVQAATDMRTRFTIAWLAADDPERVHREIDRALESWQGFHLLHFSAFHGRTQAELYAGDFAGAHRRTLETWPRIKRARVLRIQTIDHEAQCLLGRTALAAATLGDRGETPDQARRAAEHIANQQMPYGVPQADLLQAGVAALDGNEARARQQLVRAVEGFEGADMGLHAAASRWRLGELLGGDGGAAMIAEARGWMAAQRIDRPQRMLRMLAPDFNDVSPHYS